MCCSLLMTVISFSVTHKFAVNPHYVIRERSVLPKNLITLCAAARRSLAANRNMYVELELKGGEKREARRVSGFQNIENFYGLISFAKMRFPMRGIGATMFGVDSITDCVPSRVVETSGMVSTVSYPSSAQ